MAFHNWRGWTVFAVGLLSALGLIVWLLAIRSTDERAEEPDLVAAAQATLTAREEVQSARATATAAVPTLIPTVAPTPTVDPLLAQGICPVDAFASEQPVGVPIGDPVYTDWYGDEDSGLWLAPINRSGLLPGGWQERPGYWFAGETTFTMWHGTSAPLVVTGAQLDGDGSMEPVESGRSSGQNQWARIMIPEPGCWRITGHAGDAQEFAVTVEVLPLAERPDVIYIQDYLDARPYDPPSSCLVNPWTGPEARGDHYVANYWLDLNDVSLNSFGWFAAERQEGFGLNGEALDETLTVTGRLLGSTTTRASGTLTIRNSVVRGVSIQFPEPGCWEVELAGSEIEDAFTLYVYPADCAPAFGVGEIRVFCEAPES